jgi:hypothetical protein
MLATLQTVASVIRSVVCEILLRDIEALVERYLLKTRKVDIVIQIDFIFVLLLSHFSRALRGCTGTMMWSMSIKQMMRNWEVHKKLC